MKQFYSFVHKEFLHILRDNRTLLILLVMPLLMILIFGYAVSTEVRGTQVVVFDEQQTPQSHALVETLSASRYFEVGHVRQHYDDDEGQQLIRSGVADVVVIITRREGIQLLADGSEPNQAQMRTLYLQQVMAQSQLADRPVVNSRFLYNPQLLSEYNYVPGIIGMIILLICSMMTSASIVREKEMGTMEVLLASPLRPLTIILAKLVPYFLISAVNLATILVLSHYVMGMPMAGSLAGFTIISLLYIFVALALGLLISCAVSSQMAALLLSLLLIVPAIYLSGMVFPIESLPSALQRASRIVPTTWFVDAARKLLIQGVPLHYLAKNFAVLGIEAVVLIGISFKLFKKRL